MEVQRRSRLLERRWLTKSFDALASGSVLLIQAPAGYGKTTLLETWSSSAPTRVALVSASSQNFESSLSDALGRLFPSSGSEAGAEHSPHYAQLISRGPLVLAIDDVDASYTDAGIIIEDVIRRQYPQLILILSGRRIPDYGWSRLHTTGRVFRLGPEELRLRAAEVAAVLKAGSQKSTHEIEQSVEGWPAAVAISAGDRNRIESSLGSPLGEYVVSQCFAHADPLTIRLLVASHLIGGLSQRDVGIVVPGPLPADPFGTCERDSIPLTTIKRSALGAQLQVSPVIGRLAALHLAAVDLPAHLNLMVGVAACLQSQDRDDEAFDILLELGDRVVLLQHLSDRGLVQAVKGNTKIVRSWLQRLPADLATTHTQVAMMHGAVAGVEGDFESAAMWFARIAANNGEDLGAEVSPRLTDRIELFAHFGGLVSGKKSTIALDDCEVALEVGSKVLDHVLADNLRAAQSLLDAAHLVSSKFPLVEVNLLAIRAYLAYLSGDQLAAHDWATASRELAAMHELDTIATSFLVDAISALVTAASAPSRSRTPGNLVEQAAAKLTKCAGGIHGFRALGYVVLIEACLLRKAMADAAAFQERCDEALAHHGQPAPRADSVREQLLTHKRSTMAPPGTALTEAERRVLAMLATHLTVPQIARDLVVSPATVRAHVRGIYSKLNVSGRAQAVTRAAQLGLLDESP